MKRILILTDSLSLPRSVPENCDYEKTYPYLLKKYFANEIEFIHIGRGGYTLKQLYNSEIFYWKSTHFNLCFLHSGIVDCVPRALKKIELSVISRIPYASKLIPKITPFLRKVRKLTYLKKHEYAKYLKLYKDLYGDSLYFIEIIKPIELHEIRAPGITKNVEEYNNLAKVLNLQIIQMQSINNYHLMSDFHHLNERGHDEIFKALKKVIESSLKRQDLHSIEYQK